MHLRQKVLSRAEIAPLCSISIDGGGGGGGGGSTAVDASIQQLGASPKLRESLRHTVGDIVRRSSKSQSVKALATAGFVKCGIYLMEKLNRTSKARSSK